MRAISRHLAIELDQASTVTIQPSFSRARTRAAGERSRWVVTVDDRASGLAVSHEDGWRALMLEGGSQLRELARGIKSRREAGQLLAQACAAS